MVVQDCGSDVANAIARRLVLYARRPGYQSQFSPLLDARIQAENPFTDLIDWMQNNLDRPLDVPALAARAGLGERNFYRRFFAATGLYRVAPMSPTGPKSSSAKATVIDRNASMANFI